MKKDRRAPNNLIITPVKVQDLRKKAWIFLCPKGCMLAGAGVLIFLLIGIARADLVSVAQSEIGHGEQGSNNKGIYVRQYLNGREGLPWCAGFVSYCIKKSGVNLPYTLRARDYLNLGKKVPNPKAGDIIVFSRGHAAGHVGIVEKVSGSSIVTIEGNTGEFPSKVKRITYKSKPKNLLGYIRLAKAK
jgi:uncharacterized protein (TIGR02594 family)